MRSLIEENVNIISMTISTIIAAIYMILLPVSKSFTWSTLYLITIVTTAILSIYTTRIGFKSGSELKSCTIILSISLSIIFILAPYTVYQFMNTVIFEPMILFTSLSVFWAIGFVQFSIGAYFGILSKGE